jgi:hypothetical protein
MQRTTSGAAVPVVVVGHLSVRLLLRTQRTTLSATQTPFTTGLHHGHSDEHFRHRRETAVLVLSMLAATSLAACGRFPGAARAGCRAVPRHHNHHHNHHHRRTPTRRGPLRGALTLLTHEKGLRQGQTEKERSGLPLRQKLLMGASNGGVRVSNTNTFYSDKEQYILEMQSAKSSSHDSDGQHSTNDRSAKTQPDAAAETVHGGQ